MGEHHTSAMPMEVARRALAFGWSRASGVHGGGERAKPRQHSGLDLRFFGGEPLLAFGALEAIAREARDDEGRREVPLRMQVTTNATLLSPARARTLAALGVLVAVSLDGDRAAHDAG